MKKVYASASVIDIVKDPNKWQADLGKMEGKILKTAGQRIPLLEYPPNEYLFSHSTIVASVNTDQNVSHYITPQCSSLVNANGDAWERKLLLATYHTFIGAHNFEEHIQYPELSKGRVLDASIREVPNSVYVDILVATNRQHTDLIRRIEAGIMKTMSMGSIVAFTICSCCGHKAYGLTDLCSHVASMKRSFFEDENKTTRIVAELCGHHTDPASNQFMDASWVKDPAFPGAVTRSIINPSKELLDRLSSLRVKGTVIGTEAGMKKVAAASSMLFEGPAFGGPGFELTYSQDTVEQDEEDAEEDHHPKNKNTKQKRQISPDENGMNKTLIQGNKFVGELKIAGIKFSDILDFTDLFTEMAGPVENLLIMNEIVKEGIKKGVINGW